MRMSQQDEICVKVDCNGDLLGPVNVISSNATMYPKNVRSVGGDTKMHPSYHKMKSNPDYHKMLL